MSNRDSEEGPRANFLPLDDEKWPTSLQDLQGSFATELNVYRVMAHHPALLRAWRTFRDHVVSNNSLDTASLEIVILRTGRRRGSRYEWMHHVVRARLAGLADLRILSAANGPDHAIMALDALLMRCVDALIDCNRLSDNLQQELSAQFGREGVLDLIATVGMYTLLAHMVESFGTPVDDNIAAALANDPLTAAFKGGR